MIKIYAVFRIDLDRNHLLGYAAGALKDIESYYDDHKGYGLAVEPVIVNHIPPGYAEIKKEIDLKVKDLERQRAYLLLKRDC